VIGFTWYSLTDQTDWECALREKNGTVNPLGLYDLDRNIRPVGRAFKELITANR
jgi:beta-glucosidase